MAETDSGEFTTIADKIISSVFQLLDQYLIENSVLVEIKFIREYAEAQRQQCPSSLGVEVLVRPFC